MTKRNLNIILSIIFVAGLIVSAISYKYGIDLTDPISSIRHNTKNDIMSREEEVSHNKDAIEYYQQAAEKGNVEAMLELAYTYQYALAGEENFEEANKWRQKAYEAGSGIAAYNIGSSYIYGTEGIAKDPQKGYEYMQTALERGYYRAYYSIGHMYKEGIFFKRDLAKAKEYFEKGMQHNDHSSIRALAIMYHYGDGVEKDAEKSHQLALKAAELGSSMAMAYVGFDYKTGTFVDQDNDKAFEWFKKSAESASPNQPEGLYHLAMAYIEGIGVKPDYEQAIKLLEKGVYYQCEYSINALAEAYYTGEIVKQDIEKAVDLYKFAADNLNDSTAMSNLGYIYGQKGSDKYDIELALSYLHRAAQLEDSYAYKSLGIIYYHGNGVKQDYQKALEYHQKAADLGDAGALANIASLYEEGKGVKQDYAKALELYRQAADKGDISSPASIAYMYINGLGVEQNNKKAFEYYKISADQGHANSQASIGYMYYKGLGTAKDERAAIRYWLLAADQNHAEATYYAGAFFIYDASPPNYQAAKEYLEKAVLLGDIDAPYGIGLLYENGFGVEKDLNKAIEYFKQSAELGSDMANTKLGDLALAGLLPK